MPSIEHWFFDGRVWVSAFAFLAIVLSEFAKETHKKFVRRLLSATLILSVFLIWWSDATEHLNRSPRALSVHQQKELISVLKTYARQGVSINIYFQGNESADYAHQWEKVFKDAGWTVPPISSIWSFDNDPDILITVKNQDVGDANGAGVIQRSVERITGVKVHASADESMKPDQISFEIIAKKSTE